MKAPLARVLVVEDHPEIGNLMRAALTRARIEAIIITTGGGFGSGSRAAV